MNMKSIGILFLSVCASAGLVTGCNDYVSPVSGSDGRLSTISVVSSDIAFPAAGGTGLIEVAASAEVSAETSAPWCHLSVDGMKVSVSVDETVSRYGRTAVVVLRSAGDSLKVPCMQKGYTITSEIPASISARNSGGNYAYLLKSNLPTKVSVSADWITVSVENDSLRVSIQENPSSWPRSGQIACSVGGEKDTIRVTQLDIEKLIPGEYEIQGHLYGDWDKDCTAQARVELANESVLTYYGDSPEGTSKKKTVAMYHVTFPHLIKSADGSIDLSPVFQLAYYPDGGYLSWVTSVVSVNWKECNYKVGSKTMYVFSSLVNTSEADAIRSNVDITGANGCRLVLPRNSFGHYNAVPELDDEGNLCWRFQDSGLYAYKYPDSDFDGWGFFLNSNRTSITKTTKNGFYFTAKNTVMKKVGEL